MKHLRMKGRTIEDATKAALEVLKVGESEVDVKVVNEGKSGLLGIMGGEEAEVEVAIKQCTDKHAQSFLQEMLDKMGFMALVEEPKMDNDVVKLDIKGEDLGRIIGKDGDALNALEILTIAAVSKCKGERARIVVDAGDYRKRIEERVVRNAQEIVEAVIRTGEERELPPLNARERRAVHMALQDNPKVTTFSRGEGAARRLVIAPKK